jgi:hypothetical protein
MKKTRRSRHQTHQEREGAAMLVVMLILLATTSLAVFAVQTTSYEVRASGFARQAMQSEYIAEAGLQSTLTLVDRLGPGVINHTIDTQAASGVAKPTLSPFEPEMDQHSEVLRLFGEDMDAFTASGTAPVSIDALGARQAYTPSFAVDIYDHYLTSRPIPGYPASTFQFFNATYTSRGRMRLTAGDRTVVPATDPREYHETASAARAYGVSGPFAP